MIIATYNLRFGGSGRRHWTEIIAHCDPDVLLLQESYAPAEHLPPSTEGDRHLNAVWTPVATEHGSRWGSAVYFKSFRPLAVPLNRFQGWVVGAEIDGFPGPSSNNMPLRVFSLHTPSGMGDYAKVVNHMLDTVSELRDGCEIVIGGDFNLAMTAGDESDALKTRDADRQIQARLRDEFGLIHCWREANPGKPFAQTLRWSNQPDVPYHCDAIFVPASWQSRLRTCDVLSGENWIALSDHNPVVAAFC